MSRDRGHTRSDRLRDRRARPQTARGSRAVEQGGENRVPTILAPNVALEATGHSAGFFPVVYQCLWPAPQLGR